MPPFWQGVLWHSELTALQSGPVNIHKNAWTHIQVQKHCQVESTGTRVLIPQVNSLLSLIIIWNLYQHINLVMYPYYVHSTQWMGCIFQPTCFPSWKKLVLSFNKSRFRILNPWIALLHHQLWFALWNLCFALLMWWKKRNHIEVANRINPKNSAFTKDLNW